MPNPREQIIIDTMGTVIRDGFELFEEKHFVLAKEISKDHYWTAYKTSESNLDFGSTRFDLNIIGDICYLLHIELEKSFRGKGYGRQLYSCVEEFARRERCSKVVMMPSGTTFSGEDRREYLHKLGYTDIKPDGEVEKLFNIVHSDA